jgi:hypothetical protein
MSEVVRFDHARWSSWGRSAIGRGLTIPNHPGQGERPTAITVELSDPVVTCNATTSFYSTIKIRTRYGTSRFDARGPDRCVAPDPRALRAYSMYGPQVAATITCPLGSWLVVEDNNAYCDVPNHEPGAPVAMPASVGPCPEPDFYRYFGNGDANYCGYIGPVVSFE